MAICPARCPTCSAAIIALPRLGGSRCKLVIPNSISGGDASAVTVWGFFETLKVPKGEYLFQTAAGSTIGRQVIAVAKLRGVKTINLVRRKEQVQELLDIGCALPTYLLQLC